MANDAKLLHRAFHVLRRSHFRKFKISDVVDIDMALDEIWHTAQQEMDFCIEAANITRFSREHADIAYVTAPRVFNTYTSSGLIVMEDIQEISADDLAALREEGYELREIGEKIAENFIRQILDFGFFQADPHPGNFLIRGGKIAWIDLGMMGRVNEIERSLLATAVKAVASRDVPPLSRKHS